METAEYYRNHADYLEEFTFFKRLREKDFAELPEHFIKSSGYVVDTLEAALWCLLNASSYKECVLKAVNLGEDTDTVAAVAGGLAAFIMVMKAFPKNGLTCLPGAIILKDYPIYHPTLDEFTRVFYKTNLVCYNYLEVLENRGLNNMEAMIDDAIDTSELELLKALLTGEFFFG